MSPQVSEEDWKNDEQLIYLTYREMATLILVINDMLKLVGEEGKNEIDEILNGLKTKFWIELKPVLYDADVEKLGGE